MLKLDDYIEAFEMIGDTDVWIDIDTGQVYFKDYDFEEMDEDEIFEITQKPSVYLLPNKYYLNEYKDMEDFISLINDAAKQNALYDCIKGKGAFKRFKSKIYHLGLEDNWYDYKDQRLKEKVVKWLEDNEIDYLE